MIKIDELKEPPKIGEYYLVPCILEEIEIEKFENIDWDWVICNDYNMNPKITHVPHSITKYKELHIFPIINHKHSDKENGQNYEHYHIDFRFVKKNFKYKNHVFAPDIRYNLIGERKNHKIEYHKLKCVSNKHQGIAGSVKNSKLKHNCIYKGKCAHRGYDLSQEVPVNGIITCPLHGLKFDANTKKLIK